MDSSSDWINFNVILSENSLDKINFDYGSQLSVVSNLNDNCNNISNSNNTVSCNYSLTHIFNINNNSTSNIVNDFYAANNNIMSLPWQHVIDF